MSLDELEGMPQYQVPIWRSPYVKIYTLGGPNRIAEISTYPRAYEDTDPHLYTVDTPFIVTVSDLNYQNSNGDEFFQDSKGVLFSVGEQATHYVEDPLPGAFPRWIADENLPFVADPTFHIFPLEDLPAPITQLAEGEIQVGDAYIKFNEGTLANILEKLNTGEIRIARLPASDDKQIIRIRYKKVV